MNILKSELYRQDIEKAISKVDLSDLIDKSIFITGGLGLIGSAIIDFLLIWGKFNKIYVGARSESQFNLRYSNYEKIEFVRYDALKKLKFNQNVDYIICGAGIASPELYTSMPVETMMSNLNGLHELLELAKRNIKIKRVLYISSSEIYGKKNDSNPYIENNFGKIDIDNIRSVYAISKKASEVMCSAYNNEYNIETIVVRPGHIYGPSAQKNDKRVASEFAFDAAYGKKIVLKSSGLQKRSYCYSVDCAVQILVALLKGKNGQAYNISHNQAITIREMAEIYAKIGNVELISVNPTEDDIKNFNVMNNSVLDNKKLKELGYDEIFSVKEGLEHTVKILKEINK